MGPRTRRERLGTAAGIAEDLRTVREVGGIDAATPEHLAATLYLLMPLPEHTDDDLARAKAIIQERIDEAVKNLLARDGSACAYAASWSLQVLMGNLAPGTKVLVVRRQALKKYECALSTDGLRKREDALIAQAAVLIERHVRASAAAAAPQSLLEVLLPAREMLGDVADRVQTHLQTVYRFGSPDLEYFEFAVEDSLFAWAQLHYFAMNLKDVCDRVRLDAGEFFWDVLAMQLLNTGIKLSDRLPLAKALSDWPTTRAGYMRALRQVDGWEPLLEEWKTFILSCHQTCAYHRCNVIQLMCGPHQAVLMLEEAIALIDELTKGTTMKEAMLDRYDVEL